MEGEAWRAESQQGEIALREVADGDLDVFFAHRQDAEAVRMAAFTALDPTDRAAFDEHWRKIRADKDVTVRSVLVGGAVAGHVASYVDAELGKLEVTYWIGREFWGRGVATAALRAFLSVVTTRPIYGRAAKDNAASLRVLAKCGFVLVGADTGFSNARGAEVEESILELAADAGTPAAEGASPHRWVSATREPAAAQGTLRPSAGPPPARG